MINFSVKTNSKRSHGRIARFSSSFLTSAHSCWLTCFTQHLSCQSLSLIRPRRWSIESTTSSTSLSPSHTCWCSMGLAIRSREPLKHRNSQWKYTRNISWQAASLSMKTTITSTRIWTHPKTLCTDKVKFKSLKEEVFNSSINIMLYICIVWEQVVK